MHGLKFFCRLPSKKNDVPGSNVARPAELGLGERTTAHLHSGQPARIPANPNVPIHISVSALGSERMLASFHIS